MKCKKCGTETESKFCPNCGAPMEEETKYPNYGTTEQAPSTSYANVNPTIAVKKQSTLGIVALVFCAVGCLGIIGLILAIIDLAKKDATKKHTCSKIAIGIFIAYVVIGALIGGTSSNSSNVTEQTSVQEVKEPDTDEVEVAQTTTEESSEKTEDVPEEKDSYSVGESAKQNDIKVTLKNITKSNGSEYLKPDDGNEFVICEFEIENDSSKDISVSSMMSFEAYCDDYSINQDIIGLQSDEAKGKNQLDGSVAAGKKMNGIISYQVPTDWKELEITFTPDFWSSKGVTFIAKTTDDAITQGEEETEKSFAQGMKDGMGDIEPRVDDIKENLDTLKRTTNEIKEEVSKEISK